LRTRSPGGSQEGTGEEEESVGGDKVGRPDRHASKGFEPRQVKNPDRMKG